MPLINLFLADRCIYRFYDAEVSELLCNDLTGNYISEIDDQASCRFAGKEELQGVFQDLVLLAESCGSEELNTKLVELLTLVKCALWNVDKSLLEFSSIGIPDDAYSIYIEEKHRKALSICKSST